MAEVEWRWCNEGGGRSNASTMTRQLTICVLSGNKSGDGGFVDVDAGNKCLAGEMHREALAKSASDAHLPNVRELVIVPSVAKKNGIHDDLCRQPDVPADIERQFGVGLLDVRNQFVEIICPFLILQ
jgi:hypothetical protein